MKKTSPLYQSLNSTLEQTLLGSLSLIPDRLMERLLRFLYLHPELGDRWGYHIRQQSFYEPLPNFSTITVEQVQRRRDCASISWNWNQQLALLHILSDYHSEISAIAQDPADVDFHNDHFRDVDAAVYYALLRHLKPNLVIEIGSGYSTHIACRAIAQNRQESISGYILCIEPYPPPYLTEANLSIELLTQRVEDIDLKIFHQLHAGDVLFIDSTHTVKFGSDVCREILDILPGLASGVWIHIHDVFFPLDYPPNWLIQGRRAWNEQYLVEAFLAYNTGFEVALANHWVSLDYPKALADLWPDVCSWEGTHHCGSLWIRKC